MGCEGEWMKFRLLEKFLSESKADEQRLIDFAGEDLASRFFKLRQRFKSPQNDLYYWIKNKSPQELEQAVSNLENTKSNTQQRKEIDSGAKLVCESEHWKVYHITTFEASQKYGKDTKWCITGAYGEGEKYWKNYTNFGIEFYFCITKDEYDPRGQYSKVAIALYEPDDSYELYDQRDCTTTSYRVPHFEEIQIPGVDLDSLVNQQAYDYICDGCGALLSDYDESFYVDDCVYCATCFEERCGYCDNCGEYMDRDEAIQTGYEEFICPDCAETFYYVCDNCGNLFKEDDIIDYSDDEEDRLICKECAKDLGLVESFRPMSINKHKRRHNK